MTRTTMTTSKTPILRCPLLPDGHCDRIRWLMHFQSAHLLNAVNVRLADSYNWYRKESNGRWLKERLYWPLMLRNCNDELASVGVSRYGNNDWITKVLFYVRDCAGALGHGL